VNPKILLVDDEENILKQMRWALEPDYQVLTSSIEGEALSLFEKEKPAVVTLDLSLNPHNPADLGGMRLLEQILSQEPSTRASSSPATTMSKMLCARCDWAPLIITPNRFGSKS
jgi:Response regulator containing CheY-like receiver, AAA-type ATPase, and DNA-binding domains